MDIAISARILENGKSGNLRRSRRGFRGLGSSKSLGGAWFV